MPVASGASHGVSAFITLLVGTILSKFVWDLTPPVGEVALQIITFIQSMTGANIPTDEQFAGTVVVMIILSFAWGVVYHIRRHPE